MHISKCLTLPLLLILVSPGHQRSVRSIADCNPSEHSRPVSVPNSRYAIKEDGSLCCPEKERCEISDSLMNCSCQHGTVWEPCRHCMRCAKGPGENCGGPYGVHGECAESLKCTAPREEFLEGKNVTGICLGAVYKSEYEPCGGEFWEVGRCQDGLECTKVGNEHTCHNMSNLKPVCTKNCSERATTPTCGNDGRIYDNICFLRQRKCKELTLSKVDHIELCLSENVCPDIPSIPNGTVNFSDGIKKGSSASFECNDGYTQFYPATARDPSPMPSLECDCTVRPCQWVSQEKRTLWKDREDLPVCVSERKRMCADSPPSQSAPSVRPSSRPSTTIRSDYDDSLYYDNRF